MSKLEGYSLDLVNRIVWKISDLDIFGDFETVEDAIREYLGDNLGNEVLIAIGTLDTDRCESSEGLGFRCDDNTFSRPTGVRWDDFIYTADSDASDNRNYVRRDNIRTRVLEILQNHRNGISARKINKILVNEGLNVGYSLKAVLQPLINKGHIIWHGNTSRTFYKLA